MLTSPIINADLGVIRQGLCIFSMSLNLWDLAVTKKKKKRNPNISLRA
jgi:hypothetical protein